MHQNSNLIYVYFKIFCYLFRNMMMNTANLLNTSCMPYPMLSALHGLSLVVSQRLLGEELIKSKMNPYFYIPLRKKKVLLLKLCCD